MSSTFPRTRKSVLGYNAEQVEDFLEEARRAYTSERADGSSAVTSASIRHTAFTMQKGGYSPSVVDAALERLEDAFAARERDLILAQRGEQEWNQHARATAQVILDRLSRPEGQRFDRVGILTTGYKTSDVDEFARRLVDYFQHGKPLGINEVRTIAFRPAKRGYSEAQVDVLLDSVTQVMLAVR
ncbi:MAG: DivIVA domain-containing protein [Microbacteriaceae bacterium]